VSDESGLAPTLERPQSQACTAAQFKEDVYDRYCAEIAQHKVLHRKQWEYVYILSVLENYGLLKEGKTGIGFGCGKEPLVAVMAKRGCDVTATDIPKPPVEDEQWGALSLRDVFYEGICSWEDFESHVRFRSVDMRRLPGDIGRYDFVWSSCALEHLGSLKAGIEFIFDSTRCLKPGGIAVHTTEFNVSSDRQTLETEVLSIYRRRDMDDLGRRLPSIGCHLVPCNFDMGDLQEDQHVDLPPYSAPGPETTHLKLLQSDYVITSFGLIVEKTVGESSSGPSWRRRLERLSLRRS
jgi:2-polyprenyl-3-methyl-5-hydroxy-6-metoxy-1,4-benzoquinol methylase